MPAKLRRRAIDTCVDWVTERLNGEDGLGAIYPAMANSVMMFDCLGYPPDHPARAIARESIERLLVVKEDEAYCQPCVSPVWDTTLTCHALIESGGDKAMVAAKEGLDWLVPKQVLDVKGDWAVKAPNVRPGGWAFQYNNAHYPDLDDTAVVVMSMDRMRRWTGGKEYDGAIARGGQNLPGGNWESTHFNLPDALRKAIPEIAGEPTFIIMHNDAVVQGLSELPRMADVDNWAAVTIGTGLGNASFSRTDV